MSISNSSLQCQEHLVVETKLTSAQDDSDQAQAYDQVTNRPHEAKWSHELIGGAAAFEAAKAYEDHVARNGMSGIVCVHLTTPIRVDNANTRA